MRASLYLLCQLLLLLAYWDTWNTSVLVDGFYLDPGCQLANLPYKGDTCLLRIGYKGALPSWLMQRDMAAEVLAIDYPQLKRFAVEQVCPCSALSLTDQCPDNIGQAMMRLTAACPPPTRNITFVV